MGTQIYNPQNQFGKSLLAEGDAVQQINFFTSASDPIIATPISNEPGVINYKFSVSSIGPLVLAAKQNGTNGVSYELDIKSASTTTVGATKLNSATNSTSEAEAATPKAVKTVYDLANNKMNNFNISDSYDPGEGITQIIANNNTLTFSNPLDVSSSPIKIKGVIEGNNIYHTTFDLDIPETKTALGLQDAAYKSTGIASGNIPVLGVNGKLEESTIPAIALVNTYTIATANSIADIVAYVNNASTSPAAQQGDVLIINGGTLAGQVYILTTTKPVGSYVAADLTAIKVPGGTVNSINFLGTAYTPTNGTVTLPATIDFSKVSNVPTATDSTAGITKLYTSDSYIISSTEMAASMTTAKAIYDVANSKVNLITSTLNNNSTERLINVNLDQPTQPNINIIINTAFSIGPIITTIQDENPAWAVDTFQITEFVKNRVYNREITFTSANVTSATGKVAGTYVYTWTVPAGCTKIAPPRCLQVILSSGNTVIVPITYNNTNKTITITFYDPGANLANIYGGVFNTASNIHTMVLSSVEPL